jgi:sugar/nucleoside kinase (ribokinase family)
MQIRPTHAPIDYLVIGHLTKDLTSTGPRTGGTASFSSLTALALGLKVGVVTSCGTDLDKHSLQGLDIVVVPSPDTSTFENVYTSAGRIQFCYKQALPLDVSAVPAEWMNTPIVHLGPLVQEIPTSLTGAFPNSLLGLTPQGWLRSWDSTGRVSPCIWPESATILGNAQAAVISVEDVQGDEARIEEMASQIKILVVTEGANGARVFWNGDVKHFSPPKMVEVEATGAGDIFAAGYFFRLNATKDPWEAARFATKLAAFSVTRIGLDSIPTRAEIQSCYSEVL